MRFAFFSLWCIGLLHFLDASAQQLTIWTEQSPPASMMIGGQVVGRETSKVQEIMRRGAIAYSIGILPWKRGYLTTLNVPGTCLFSTIRTAERENLFHWVGPLNTAQWQLWGRADHPWPLNSLEDARGLRIGTLSGDARDDYLRSRGFDVHAVDGDLLNVQKLINKRIDLWAVSLPHGTESARAAEWGGDIVPLLTFRQVKTYLACNKSVPDVLIDRMNIAVGHMVQDGTMQRYGR